MDHLCLLTDLKENVWQKKVLQLGARSLSQGFATSWLP